MPEPILYSIEASAETLAVSPDTIRRMIARDDLPHVRIGSRVLVPVEAVRTLAAPDE